LNFEMSQKKVKYIFSAQWKKSLHSNSCGNVF